MSYQSQYFTFSEDDVMNSEYILKCDKYYKNIEIQKKINKEKIKDIEKTYNSYKKQSKMINQQKMINKEKIIEKEKEYKQIIKNKPKFFNIKNEQTVILFNNIKIIKNYF